MRLRNTLVALLLFAALGAWIYLYEYRGEPGREEAESKAKKLFTIETETVEGLDLIRPDGTVSLRRADGAWRLTAPIEARADGEEVSSLLSTLGWLEAESTIPAEGADLGAFKLDTPALRVVVHPGEGKPDIELAVGDKAPIGSAYYARRGGGGDVVTVASSIDRLLEATADRLRDKKVVGLDSWKVSRFSIEREGRRLAFGNVDGDWRIESPTTFPAERGKVSNLLYDLTALAAEGFEPEGTQPSAAGLGAPVATLRIEEKDGPSVTVEFSARGADGIVRARRPDRAEIYRVKGEILDKLATEPAEFRDLRVAPVDRYQVTEIRAAAGGAETVIVKDEEANWRWGTLEGATLPGDPVNALLDALEAAKALDLIEDPAAAGIGAAEAALKLSVKAGSHDAVEIRIGAARDGKARASSNVSKAIYEIDGAAAEKLIAAVGALKPPEAASAAGSPAAVPAAPGTTP